MLTKQWLCMLCIIYSKTKSVNQHIWSRIKTHRKDEKFEKYTLDKLIENFGIVPTENTESTHQGTGFFVNINDTPYVITCNHVIGPKVIETCAFADNVDKKHEQIKLTLVRRIPELDIAVLKFKNDQQKKKFVFYTPDQLDTKINHITRMVLQDITNASLNIPLISTSLCETKITIQKVKISHISIETEDFISHIVPKLPLITFFHDETQVRLDNLPGCSGSLILCNDIPIGMLASFSQKSKKLQAIPTCLIFKIVINSLNDLTKTISGFNIPTLTVRVDLDKCVDGKSQFIGKCVEKKDTNNNIEYCTIYNKKFYFKDNDVIIKVSDKEFDNNGKIFSDEIGYDVNIDMFMMLECFIHKKNNCKFLVIRNDGETEKHIDINIIGKTINTMYNTKIFNDHIYVSWKGFTFAELSEELVDNLAKIFNFDIQGSFITSPKMNSGDKKVVVVVDVDKRFIPEKYGKTFFVDEQILTPFVHTDSGKKLVFLEKIGNKKILSINDLENVINGTNTNSSKLNKSTRSMSLIYENNGVYVTC